VGGAVGGGDGFAIGRLGQAEDLPRRFVVPVADEPHAETCLHGQVLLMRRRDRFRRQPFDLVVDVDEQRHEAQHTGSGGEFL
jgi:hypothetical protein